MIGILPLSYTYKKTEYLTHRLPSSCPDDIQIAKSIISYESQPIPGNKSQKISKQTTWNTINQTRISSSNYNLTPTESIPEPPSPPQTRRPYPTRSSNLTIHIHIHTETHPIPKPQPQPQPPHHANRPAQGARTRKKKRGGPSISTIVPQNPKTHS